MTAEPQTDLSRVIAKVRKLLSLAASTSQHEADVALAQAMKLMDQHRLSMDAIDDVKSSQNTTESIAEDPEPMLANAASHPHWKKQLFASLCTHNGCAAVRSRNAVNAVKGRLVWHESFVSVGRESDRLMTRFMYEFCVRAITQFSRQKAKLLPSPRERDAYRWGIVVGIHATLKAARQREDNVRFHTRPPGSSSSTALAVIDRRLAHVQNWISTEMQLKERDKRKRGPNVDTMDFGSLAMGIQDGGTIRMPSVPIYAPEKRHEIEKETR